MTRMTCPSFRALLAGALLGAPLAAQWPTAEAIPEDPIVNEVMHEVVRFEVNGSTTSARDCILVPYISVANVPKYWEIFAQSILPSVRYHSQPNVNNEWINELNLSAGVSATGQQLTNYPYRMPTSVAKRAVDELIWNSLGNFTRPISATSPVMHWPNDNWPQTGGSSMLWSNSASTLDTKFFDREGLIRQIIVNQHEATTGFTLESNSTEVNTLVTMIKEDIAEFELTVLLIEIQDPPQGTTPANLKISLSSTVKLKLAAEGEIDKFFCVFDYNDYSVALLPGESWSPYAMPLVLNKHYEIGVHGALLPGMDVRMALPLATGGWLYVPTTTSLTPNLNTAVKALIPNNPLLVSGMIGLVDFVTGMPIPIMAPGPNGPTETSLYADCVIFQPWTLPPL